MDYPITIPTAPGEYTSTALEEQNGTLTVRADGTAITSSTIRDTTYSHPILNLPSWAELFGPFRELSDDDTDPDPAATATMAATVVTELDQVLTELDDDGLDALAAQINGTTETITVAETNPEEIAA